MATGGDALNLTEGHTRVLLGDSLAVLVFEEQVGGAAA
jgi:hypothetical protein